MADSIAEKAVLEVISAPSVEKWIHVIRGRGVGKTAIAVFGNEEPKPRSAA